MLTLFPQLLFLSAFAPLVIRIIVGLASLRRASLHIKHKNVTHSVLSILFVLTGIALIVGFQTQLMAVVSAVLLILSLIPIFRNSHTSKEATLILIFIVLTLVVTGAGLYAIDLPL